MGKDRIPPMLRETAGGIDLAAIRDRANPGTLNVEINLRYVLNVYEDVNDALPLYGIIDTVTGKGPAAVSFTGDDGVARFYTLAPNTIETFQQFLGYTKLDEARQYMLAKVAAALSGRAVIILDGEQPEGIEEDVERFDPVTLLEELHRILANGALEAPEEQDPVEERLDRLDVLVTEAQTLTSEEDRDIEHPDTP